jgi:hypothetical protein
MRFGFACVQAQSTKSVFTIGRYLAYFTETDAYLKAGSVTRLFHMEHQVLLMALCSCVTHMGLVVL